MDERNYHFDFDFTPIGQAIKKAREARGMTREQLSGIIGYAPRHIQSIISEYMGDILLIPVTAPAHPLRHHIRKLFGVGGGVSPIVAPRPCDIPIPEVVPLQRQPDMLHVNRVLHPLRFAGNPLLPIRRTRWNTPDR